MIAGVACQAREMRCGCMPEGWRADGQPRELELGHQPGRSLAVIVMVVGAGAGVVIGIGLYGRTVIVGMRIDGRSLLVCAMIVV